MTPFVAYYRVSTERQGRSGLGIEAQRMAVARFAEAEDLERVAEFTEIEVGSRINRTLSNELQIAVDLKRHQTWTSGARARNNYQVGSISISRRF